MTRLDPETVEEALDIQARSFRLLSWLESALDRGFVAPDAASDYGSDVDGATEWLERHSSNLPPDARVEAERVRALAGFFTTYLAGTFELDGSPGQRLYSEGAHCFCPMCSFMVRRPHLRPRSVGRKDKERAQRMMVSHLRGLANTLEIGRNVDLEALAQDSRIREELALCTYVADVRERMDGRIHGAAPLALWRIFAWTPEGSPKKKFRLKAKSVLAAQEWLVNMLQRAPGSQDAAGS